MRNMRRSVSDKRINYYLIFVVVIVAIYGIVLAKNVVSSDGNDADSTVKKYDVIVEAARGEIFDRNGANLVSNRQGNSIEFNAAVFPSKQADRNRIIGALVELCDSKNEKWKDNLPIIYDENGQLVFVEDRQADISSLKNKNMLNLNSYATAENCLDALIDMYKLEDFDRVTARKIASVCYEMWRTGFSVSMPYVFAEDVSGETISIIKEKSEFFRGVEAQVDTYREFTDGTIAPHIIGVTGIISSEEYDANRKKLEEEIEVGNFTESEIENIQLNSYSLSDYVGKFGIESAMENELRGKKGIKTITVDDDGNVMSDYTLMPSQGNSVYLTIDSGLQRVAQNSLEKRILELTANSVSELDAAGAVVVIDVDTGEILASASYPSYNLTEYFDKYNELLKADGTPLINRVLYSTYEPGSTMKLSTAIAGLENGAVAYDDKFFCNSIFQYYDVTFSCLDSHGNINVTKAIEESCNIFFYNIGDLLGIDVMNEYSSKLGLGQKTGVELSESKGILAGRAYRESVGLTWMMGDTIQAGIGQSDNLFTIIQLGNYCATIANGGTRYECHYVKNIMNSDHSQVLYEHKPVVIAETGISQQTIDTVKEGMLAVTTTGSCRTAFSRITEKVGAKTGTTQVKKIVDGKTVKGNNGLNISFAPFDEPEIAVAVIIESVDSGTATAVVAADIYDYYFSTKNQISSSQQTNQLLR